MDFENGAAHHYTSYNEISETWFVYEILQIGKKIDVYEWDKS